MSNVTRWFVELQTQSINDSRRINFAKREDDPIGGVDRHSAVFATVTEVAAPPGGPLDFPFQGAAMLAVNNIVPQDDGSVQIVVRVVPEFYGLNIRIQFLVSND
ncbi:MAG: hypothetical protein ACJ8GJ_02400 [Vitreoscilla sp.]